GSLAEAVGQGSTAADLDVQYEGPLARAQRTIEITAQDRVVAFVTGVATAVAPFAPQLAQEIFDVLKLDKMVRDRSEITGLPSDSLRSDEELQEMRGERQAAAAEQQKKNDLAQMAESVGKVSPALTAMQKPQQGKAA